MSKVVKKERLVLLDAHAIIHRAYHALPDFSTSSGVPTGALYGLVSMVLKIATDLKPDYIVACYDLPKPTYRHEVYEGYKAGRAKANEDLVSQIEKSKELCAALNIPIYEKEGFEADDLLGTIVEKLRSVGGKGGIEIIIASGDMDTLQLVDNDYVKVYTLKKGLNDTILYDDSAVKERFGFPAALVPDYKGLRGDPSDNIVGIQGIGEKTATELIKAFGSIDDIYKHLKKDSSSFEKKGFKKRIIDLLTENEEEAKFSLMLATIRRDAPIDFKLPNKYWKDSFDIEAAKRIFTDLEFRNMSDRLKKVMDIKEEPNSNKQTINQLLLEETKVALWLINSNISNPTLDDIYNFGKTEDFSLAREKIMNEIKNRELEFVYEKIEKPIIPIVEKMQTRGVLIDTIVLKNMEAEYEKELKIIEKKIWKEAGTEFNIASPKQLGEVLFGTLGLKVKNQKKTSTGAMSTKESELEKLKKEHPIINLVLEYRELAKLISTYIKPIQEAVDKESRLHARFIQTGTTTGRMSSENPNLQNIPISSERGFAIRKAVIAPKGFVLAAFDYSQIELRIAAMLSLDKNLIEIFKDGSDAHTAVASLVFGVAKGEVTKEMRRQAKVINFGILYGMGVNALQQNLGSDRKTAQEFLNSYFEKFSGLAEYIESIKKDASNIGFTKTLFGRRRYFEGIKSKIPYIRAAAERMAINAPIQGTQADIIKVAMRRIDDWVREEGLDEKVFPILQIHDELVFEIEEKVLEKVQPKIKEIMEGVLTLEQSMGVPIIANSVTGKNWAELK